MNGVEHGLTATETTDDGCVLGFKVHVSSVKPERSQSLTREGRGVFRGSWSPKQKREAEKGTRRGNAVEFVRARATTATTTGRNVVLNRWIVENSELKSTKENGKTGSTYVVVPEKVMSDVFQRALMSWNGRGRSFTFKISHTMPNECDKCMFIFQFSASATSCDTRATRGPL